MEIRGCRLARLLSRPTFFPAMLQEMIPHPFENPKRPHLEPGELERFLRGELGRAETRRVVRHLLTRCPQCAAVVRPLWEELSEWE
jgi:hypothetical protein